jgi:hypothetical protein
MYTNYNVFKKFTNRPNVTIGPWLFYKSGFSTHHIWNHERSRWGYARWNWSDGSDSIHATIGIDSMSCLDYDKNGDNIFLFAGIKNQSFNKILHYIEPNTYRALIGLDNLNSYSSAETNLSNAEMLQGMVFNKEIYKILKNLYSIKNYITGRYTADYDYLGNIVLGDMEAMSSDEYLSINVGNLSDFYVHENEILSHPGTLNRIFNKIYNVQNDIIKLIAVKILNYVPSLSGSQTIVLS